jgi:hypothetical protein
MPEILSHPEQSNFQHFNESVTAFFGVPHPEGRAVTA